MNIEYPPLPQTITDLCTVVRTPIDYGPICKLYGALMSEHDPDTLIITVDDDCIYGKNMVENMLEKNTIRPNAAITGAGVLINDGNNMSINTNFDGLMFMNGFLCGFQIPHKGRLIDIVQGISGCLYYRKFFPDIENINDLLKYTEDEDIYKSDDILTSSYLCSKNIKRYTFNNMYRVQITIASGDALSSNLSKMLETFKRAVKKCQDYHLLVHLEPASFYDSPTVKTPFWFVILFIVFILIVIIIANPHLND